MKNSTRIALAATVVLLGIILVGHLAQLGLFWHLDDAIAILIIGLVVIWLLKFILGTFVDKKGEK